MSSTEKNTGQRNGFLDARTTDTECDFSIKAEIKNNKIVAAKGYFTNYFIYKVYGGTHQTLTDIDTGIKFSIFITQDHFSFSRDFEGIDKLLS
jgi:hypothetical protein